MASPLLGPEIVQAAGDFHDLIREAVLGIAQHVLNNPAPFHTRQGMLDPDADPGQLAIGLLFGFRQVALRGLFFGMYVRSTCGA